jgi:hypothetical protein
MHTEAQRNQTMEGTQTTAHGVKFTVAAGDLFVYVPGVSGVALVAPRAVEASTIELELRTLWGALIARAIYRDLVALLSGERPVVWAVTADGQEVQVRRSVRVSRTGMRAWRIRLWRRDRAGA